VVDILLTGAGGKSAAFRDTVELQEGETAELVFEPPAEQFLTEEEQEEQEEQAKDLTALITIRAAEDSSGLKISAGGSGAARTRTLVVPNGAQTVYLAALKKSSQTLTISGDDAAKVSKAAAAAGGETPGPTKDIFIVDSSAIAETGGSMGFVITVGESGKLSIAYAFTLNIPSLTDLLADFRELTEGTADAKIAYLVGEEFDRSTVSVTGTYSDGTKNVVITDYEVTGFDSSQAGVLAVQFKKSGITAFITGHVGGKFLDSERKTLAITILSPSGARLFFPYGGRLDEEVPQRNRYTVTQGRTLVIAPVCWRVPAGATFQWTVSGTSAYTTNGEYLTFLPGAVAGNYNVTVTASFDGQSVSASTSVECVNASSPPSEDRECENGAFAPGQNVGKWNTSLGGFGGSAAYTLGMGMDNGPGDDIRISGNAFGAWVEPGIIWVMKDENHNGKMDDTWYELKGNAEELGWTLTRRYAVAYYPNNTWEDSLGNYGALGPLQATLTPSSPTITLAGTMLDRSTTNAMGWDLRGYVDVIDDLFDISDAVQADGTPIYLDHIDFVRVQTGEHQYTGLFGEISTEITGGSAGIGPVWDEGRTLAGTSGGGGYTYSFVNNSGYDLSVWFRDIAGTLSVPAGQTVPYTSPESKLYYNYSGGNVNASPSGNTLTFTNG
jgi:hypothetical protein